MTDATDHPKKIKLNNGTPSPVATSAAPLAVRLPYHNLKLVSAKKAPTPLAVLPDLSSFNADPTERLARLEALVAKMYLVQHAQSEEIKELTKHLAAAEQSFAHLRNELIIAGRDVPVEFPKLTQDGQGRLVKLPDELIFVIFKRCTWQSKLRLREVSRMIRTVSNLSIKTLPFPAKTNAFLAVAKQFVNLRAVHLTGDGIDNLGVANLAGLGQLQTIQLRQMANITDEALFHLKQLPKLTSIDIESVRQFSRYGIQVICRLSQLRQLRVSDFDSMVFPTSDDIKCIEKIDVHDCYRVTCNYALMGKFTNLQHLLLDSADCTLQNFSFVSNLTKLTYLTFNFWGEHINGPTALGTTDLGRLVNLCHLNLIDTTAEDYSFLANLSKLTHFAPGVGFGNGDFKYLTVPTKLRSLAFVSVSHLSDDSVSLLHPLSNTLENLSFKYVHLTDACFASLLALTKLQSLLLGGTSVADVDAFKTLAPEVEIWDDEFE